MLDSMELYVLLKFASGALLPPASLPIGLLLSGVLALLRFWRTAKVVALLAIAQGIFLILPPVADALIAPLEQEARVSAQRAKPCCYSAIVLLGGGIFPASPPAMPSAHLVNGADRTVYAAELFHQQIAPRIIASGGRPSRAPDEQTEADAMKAMLMRLGVPADAVVLEDRSLNTLENIAFVHRIVGDEAVALVTSAYHMPRALRISSQVGLRASAFPTDWQVPSAIRYAWGNWLPTVESENIAVLALREHLAAIFDSRMPP